MNETLIISEMGITDIDKADEKLRIELVNTKLYENFLKTVPHKEFLDLSAIYKIVISEESVISTAVVDIQTMESWGITTDELHEKALESTKKAEPVRFIRMTEIVGSFCGMQNAPQMDEVFVITNQTNFDGAASILYEETLQKLADIFKQDCYILPCSVHEVIALRADEDADAGYLKTIVADVNSTVLRPDEILSGSVYHYSIAAGRLSIM